VQLLFFQWTVRVVRRFLCAFLYVDDRAEDLSLNHASRSLL
jgi:hypothetical protein